MTFLPIDILDEIFRFTEKPSVVLYFKRVLSRQTICLLYNCRDIDIKNSKAMDLASECGYTDIVRYLHETLQFICTTYAMDHASRFGHLETVKYLHESVGAKCTTLAMGLASSNGHLEIVKYLHEVVRAKCNTDAMDCAIEYNCLDVVRYLHEVVGCNKYSQKSVLLANYYGHTEVVKYLHLQSKK